MNNYLKHLRSWIRHFPNPFNLHTYTGVLGGEELWCLICGKKSTRTKENWDNDSEELIDKYG